MEQALKLMGGDWLLHDIDSIVAPANMLNSASCSSLLQEKSNHQSYPTVNSESHSSFLKGKYKKVI